MAPLLAKGWPHASGETQLNVAPCSWRATSLALKDGSRIDDNQLISGGRNRARTLWLFASGSDTFVAVDDVVDLWETSPGTPVGRVKAH